MKHYLDAFYDFMDQIGYMHPIHPTMVHMPIGLVVGATVSIGIAALARFHQFRVSAHHVLVLALIFWFPTVLFGILDWQRYLGGAWLFVIKMKLALASALLVFLVTGIVLGYRGKTAFKVLVLIYGLCFATVVVLGYFGGQLVYSGHAPAGSPIYRTGEKVFDNNCTGCHAHGGNVFAPDLPLAHASQLGNFGEFEQFIRNPKMPNGTAGDMPAFTASKISDEEAKALYDYIVHVIEKPSPGLVPPISPSLGAN